MPNKFSTKLNDLFLYKTKSNGKSFTNQDVATGTGLAVSYIWRLRQESENINPGYEAIGAICKFFDVEPNYFFDVEGEDLNAGLNDNQVREIALRASELDDKGKQSLLEMANYIRELQKKNEKKEET
jgi:transcriptional regulator with XRE-family HTH domain